MIRILRLVFAAALFASGFVGVGVVPAMLGKLSKKLRQQQPRAQDGSFRDGPTTDERIAEWAAENDTGGTSSSSGGGSRPDALDADGDGLDEMYAPGGAMNGGTGWDDVAASLFKDPQKAETAGRVLGTAEKAVDAYSQDQKAQDFGAKLENKLKRRGKHA